eukprot:scaffold1874_cov109-Isochrysis_galbana.AAC.8
MVSSSLDPSLPTATELAGDTPADGDGMNIDQPSERQARHSLARRAQLAHQYNTIHYTSWPWPLCRSPKATLHHHRLGLP